MSGKLIVFEGVEGCGKTTQMQFCLEWLQSLNITSVLTREPGGTDLGTDLRRLLLFAKSQSIADRTELLLFAADRAQHVEQKLKPNLAQDKIILCDRYTDSTIAYQGWGRGLDINLINQLNAIATSGLKSDLTLWLDVDVEVGLVRKKGSGVLVDRMEKETIAFHRRVQQGYAQLYASYPQQMVRVDASLDQLAVFSQIQAILTHLFKAWGYL